MPLNLKADAARKRYSYIQSAEQRAHKAALKAQYRARMTPDQKAHQSTLRAQ
jgi:hypothetical protein